MRMQVAETMPVRFAWHGQIAVSRSFDLPTIHVSALRTEQQPDLIILDVIMPIMNGFQFMEKYREISFEKQWQTPNLNPRARPVP